ncbi:hypothetical protein L0Y65_02755 [Candidatus Micrarchaeota archaeon]|nr:hypothetical protein [Candidatus Micrarchaeota archaeon]
MIVILDTSCISAFILAGRVGLLLEILKGQDVAITEQVQRELGLSRKPLLRDFRHQKIMVMQAESAIADRYNIHIGEASVISLAAKTRGLAVIDDKKARKAAQEEGIEYVGTATIIRFGLEKGAISRDGAEKLIGELISAGFIWERR